MPHFSTFYEAAIKQEKPVVMGRYRHIIRGTVYLVISIARRQTKGLEGAFDVVYKDVITGESNTRELSEFMDGRFERVA